MSEKIEADVAVIISEKLAFLMALGQLPKGCMKVTSAAVSVPPEDIESCVIVRVDFRFSDNELTEWAFELTGDELIDIGIPDRQVSEVGPLHLADPKLSPVLDFEVRRKHAMNFIALLTKRFGHRGTVKRTKSKLLGS